MLGLLDRLARPVLFGLDPETAHEWALRGLALNLHPGAGRPDPILRQHLLGLDFASPVGLAAGFDKNARALPGLARLGFGSLEVGTVTPRPQPGNPPPRLWRQQEEQAIVNRLGFPGEGMAAVRARLDRVPAGVVLGVNLGANKDSTDRIGDYVAGIEVFADVAAYFALNVSSPNTPGLRTLQGAGAVDELLGRTVAARDAAAGRTGRRVPLLVKLAPDLEQADLEAVAAAVLGHGVDGAILTNTTLSRDGVRDPAFAAHPGGLSGPPLFRRATVLLARFRKLVGAKLPLIGVGGIDSGETAWQKIEAGANLVQLLTAFVFGGLAVAEGINRDLARRLRAEGASTLSAITGRRTDQWAAAGY